jgi:hypothetical protein
MSTEILHPEGLSQGPPHSGRPAVEDEVDAELLALPPPAQGQRRVTLVLLALVALMATVMAVSLRGEAAYALTPSVPVDVGDLYAFDAAKLEPNRYVRAQGALGGALAVRFERPFESDTYRVSPVMGRRNLWVEVRVPAGEEGGRYVPPTAFGGRLVRWSDSGLRHRGLEHAVHSITGETIPGDAWLLVDGEAPSAARWSLGLAVMFAAFGAWSAITIGRLLRRVS